MSGKINERGRLVGAGTSHLTKTNKSLRQETGKS